MIDTPKYLTVAECLERLPLRVSEREFRREVRELGLCYRRGQIITLSEDHLAQYIKTLEAKPCPTSSCKDCSSEHFWKVRHDCIPEGSSSVHPIGNPIIHSTNCGSGRTPRAAWPSISVVRHPAPKFVPNVGFVYPLDFLGVGNNPDAISTVGGTKDGSRYAFPDCIVPERGQVSENVSKPVTKQLCAVFHDDVSRSNFANQSRVFAPETRSSALDAFPLARRTDVLTWEPAADDINGKSISSKIVGAESSDVFINRNLRPVFRENETAEWFDLAERHGFKPAGPFQAQRETANPAKQVENLQHRARTLLVGFGSPTRCKSTGKSVLGIQHEMRKTQRNIYITHRITH
jgi:hypothetical protein